MTPREYLLSQNKLQNSYTLDEVVALLNEVRAKSLNVTPYRTFKHMIDEEFGTVQEFSNALKVTRKTAYGFMSRPNSLRVRHLILLKKKGIEPVNLITLNEMEGEE
jgi:hypothetical protein